MLILFNEFVFSDNPEVMEVVRTSGTGSRSHESDSMLEAPLRL
jgi:hypothetical protein